MFYNIERLLGLANFMPTIYLVAPLSVLPVMMLPRLQLSLPWLLGLPIPVVVFLRLWLEYPISGASLPLTTMEIGCVGLTGVLARQVRQNVEDLRRSAAEALNKDKAAAEARIAEIRQEAQNTLAAKLDEARGEATEVDRVRSEEADEAEVDELRTDLDRLFQRDTRRRGELEVDENHLHEVREGHRLTLPPAGDE